MTTKGKLAAKKRWATWRAKNGRVRFDAITKPIEQKPITNGSQLEATLRKHLIPLHKRAIANKEEIYRQAEWLCLWTATVLLLMIFAYVGISYLASNPSITYGSAEGLTTWATGILVVFFGIWITLHSSYIRILIAFPLAYLAIKYSLLLSTQPLGEIAAPVIAPAILLVFLAVGFGLAKKVIKWYYDTPRWVRT